MPSHRASFPAGHTAVFWLYPLLGENARNRCLTSTYDPQADPSLLLSATPTLFHATPFFFFSPHPLFLDDRSFHPVLTPVVGVLLGLCFLGRAPRVPLRPALCSMHVLWTVFSSLRFPTSKFVTPLSRLRASLGPRRWDPQSPRSLPSLTPLALTRFRSPFGDLRWRSFLIVWAAILGRRGTLVLPPITIQTAPCR